MSNHTRWLLSIIGLYLLFGFGYSMAVPIFEAPDENLHFQYVRYLADNRALPTYRGEILPMRQEVSQPPLYYALGSLLTFWIDISDYDSVIIPYRHAVVGLADVPGNRNVFLHSTGDTWPYRGAVLAAHLVRGLSVMLGALTILFTYWGALALFPEQPDVALAGAAVNAFTPGFIFIAAAVNNDNLAALAGAAVFALVARGLRTGWTPRQQLALGVVVGVAALAKLNALGVAPLVGLIVMGTYVTRHGWRQWRAWGRLTTEAAVRILGPALIIAGWWYARNWMLYGDPFASRAHFDVMAPRTAAPTLPILGLQLLTAFKSWWGVFGWLGVVYPENIYRVFMVFSLAAFVGYLWAWRRNWRAPNFILPVLWLMVLVVELVGWAYFQSAQGRLLFPAVSAIAVILASGLVEWIPGRGKRPALFGLCASLALLAALTPGMVILPVYEAPAALTPAARAAIAHPLDADFGGEMRLLGYDLASTSSQPGEAVRLTLYWQSKIMMDRTWSLFVHIVDDQDIVIAQADQYPGMGTLPTPAIPLGRTWREQFSIRIPSTSYAPAEARIRIGVYDADTGERLSLPNGDDALVVSPLTVGARPGDLPNSMEQVFDNLIQLDGYEMDQRTVPPGESLHLTLYWRALKPIPVNYSVFVHVLGEGNSKWAAVDSWPQGGNAPTATWEVGNSIRDDYDLRLSPETPPGTYDVEVGLYNTGTNQRLRLVRSEGQPVMADALFLSKIRVAPP